MIVKIGNAAGDIWKKLRAEGDMVITKLQRKTGLPVNLFYLGLGWLARENKVSISIEKRTIRVSLKE
ncbi:MAG TPA: winged helix-turn-helix domain-containing protein [bacterium]